MMQTIRIIDRRLYPRKVILEARQAYEDFLSIIISPSGSHQDKMVITVKREHEAQRREVVLEFLNYLLARSAETHFEAE